MDKKSTMNQDVAQANASADPESWINRYEYDATSGRIVEKGSESAPEVMSHIHVEQRGDKIVAHVPVLATGSHGNYNPLGFGNNTPLDKLAMWELTSNDDGKAKMRKAIHHWENDPIAYRCIQILVQLATTRFIVECEDEQFCEIVQTWTDAVMGHTFRSQFFLEFWRTGMVPILKQLVPYSPRNYRLDKIPRQGPTADNVEVNTPTLVHAKTKRLADESKRAFDKFKQSVANYENAVAQVANGLQNPQKIPLMMQAMARAQYEWTRGAVPGAYTILNPLAVDIEGPAGMSWMREPYLKVDNDLQRAIQNPNLSQQVMLQQMPFEIVQQIRQGAKKVWLSPNMCSVVYGDKQPYERYPTPMLSHAFDALDQKCEMQAMDRFTVQCIKNRILKVTIGNDQYPALNANEIKQVAKMFNNPSRHLVLFWNHTLQVEWVEVSFEAIKSMEKYKFVNDEIRTCCGISTVLTGTSEGGAIGNNIINFKGVEAQVLAAQAAFLEFWNQQIQLLKQALQVSKRVTGRFVTLNLKDENKFMAVLMSMVQNGLIDHETANATLGHNFPMIVSRMKKVKEMQEQDGILLPTPSANNLGPGGGIPTGGKPADDPGADNNDNKVGTSQPQLAAASVKMVDHDGKVYLVVDAAAIPPEQQLELANTFGCPAESVMAKATFEEHTGESIVFDRPLPQLTSTEFMMAMKEATQVKAEIDARYEQLANDFKDEGDGPRGKYVTTAVADRLRSQAMSESLSQLRGDFDEGEWGRRLEPLVAGLDPDQIDEDERHVIAATMLRKQLAKAAHHNESKPKAAKKKRKKKVKTDK